MPSFCVGAIGLLCLLIQEPLPRETALDRPGVHHATVRGRFVDEGGDPISDVRVIAYTRVSALGFTPLPLRETHSMADGVFVLEDVSAFDPIALFFAPPFQWSDGGRVLDLVSARITDLGDIELATRRRLRCTIERVDASRIPTETTRVSLRLLPDAESQNQGGPHILLRSRAGQFELDNCYLRSGELVATIRFEGRTEEYSLPIDLEAPDRRSRDIHLLADSGTLRPGAGKNAIGGRLEIVEDRPLTDSLLQEVTGRLVSPDGDPISGCLVRLGSRGMDLGPRDHARTGSDGSFHVSGPRSAELLYLSWFRQSLIISQEKPETDRHRLFQSLSWKTADLAEPLEIVLDGAKSARLQLRGAPGVETSWSYWRGDQWIPLEDPAWFIPDEFYRVTVRAEPKSGLPKVAKLTRADLESGSHTIAYGEIVRQTIHVVSEGRPVPGAWIDIDELLELERPERLSLTRLRAGSDGVVSFDMPAIDPEQARREAFAYAPGFQSGHAGDLRGGKLIVELVPASVEVTLSGLNGIDRVRLRQAGREEAAAVVWPKGRESAIAEVAPGRYDVVALSSAGEVAAQGTIDVAGAAEVDVSSLQSPRVRLKLPELPVGADSWWVEMRRRASVGSAAQAMAWSQLSGPFSSESKPARLEWVSTREAVLSVYGSGHYEIQVHARHLPGYLIRRIQIEPGAEKAISLPPLEAALKGQTEYRPKGLFHGVAGPRMYLRADDPDGWDVSVMLPKIADDGSFALELLPPGRYHCFHHLMEDAYSPAYGGLPVELRAREATELPPLEEATVSDLIVRVRLGDDSPAEGTIAIRDLMAESWAEVETGGSTRRYAADPIPAAPVRRLEKGRATLPRVRTGRLELVVSLDDGRRFAFTRDVDPEKELILTVPDR